MRLIFYNLWHNGDIHYTRSFIRDIMKKTNYDEYQYCHNSSPKLLQDIPNLIFGRPNEYCKETNIILRVNDDLYVNVHIGCYDILFDDNVDSESHSILKTYYILFLYIYEQLGLKIDNPNEYTPIIDYNSYELDNINSFLESNKYPKVLVSNGNVLSGQFGEIDFTTLVNQLSDDYPYIQFILTNNLNLVKPNVFFTNDIIKSENGDLNEISYLSRYCTVIFGRPSGPYAFCHVKENLKDRYKTFISPSAKLRWITWGIKSSCKNVWINKTGYDDIYTIVKDELKNISSLTLNEFNVRCGQDRIFISPKINITPEHDLNIIFWLGTEMKWEHKSFVGNIDNEFWYQPFMGYDKDIHRVRVEFRTSKNTLFDITL
jgi:hypothetical protein